MTSSRCLLRNGACRDNLLSGSDASRSVGVRPRLHKTLPGGVYPVTVRRLRTASARTRRRLRWTQTAFPLHLLITEAAPGAGVAGPVPLCCGDDHARPASPVSRKLYTYPVGTAGGEGLSGGGCNIPGTPSGANPGGLLVRLSALTNPGPSPAPLRAVQSFSNQRVKKVKNP